MTYDKIYSAFYLIVDRDFFKLDKEVAREYMHQWLHNAIATPYIRELFSSVSLDDYLEELTFEVKNPSETYDTDNFVIDVLSKFMKISWNQYNIDTAINRAKVIGGKDEKMLIDPYKNNMDRLDVLEKQLRKTIMDYNSNNNDYVGGVI